LAAQFVNDCELIAEKRRVEMRVPNVGSLCSEMGADGAERTQPTSRGVRNVGAMPAKWLVFGD
jgi:hypothetical protein